MHKKRLALALLAGLCSLGSTQAFGQQAFATRQQVQTKEAIHASVPSVLGRSLKLGHSPADRVLHLAVTFPYGDPEGLQTFVNNVNNPKSRLYRQYLTPEQVGEKFGLP